MKDKIDGMDDYEMDDIDKKMDDDANTQIEANAFHSKYSD